VVESWAPYPHRLSLLQDPDRSGYCLYPLLRGAEESYRIPPWSEDPREPEAEVSIGREVLDHQHPLHSLREQ